MRRDALVALAGTRKVEMNRHERYWHAIRMHNLVGPRYGGGSRITVPREPASIGIGAAKSGRESNPAPRPRPPADHMRSERPAPPRTAAERLWPGLARGRR
jgi:hypothetical protein